jgi:hypothetical protein
MKSSATVTRIVLRSENNWMAEQTDLPAFESLFLAYGRRLGLRHAFVAYTRQPSPVGGADVHGRGRADFQIPHPIIGVLQP